MTKSRFLLPLSAAAISLGIALAPAASFGDEMKKDTMGKDKMEKSNMSKDSMKKDTMGKDTMGKKDKMSDGMKK